LTLAGGIVTKLLDAATKAWDASREATREDKRLQSQKVSAQSETIGRATMELLRALSGFRHWEKADIELASGCDHAVQAYSLLQTREFAWEQAVWPWLNDTDRARVTEVRHRFEAVRRPTDLSDNKRSEVPELSNTILEVARAATAAVQSGE